MGFGRTVRQVVLLAASVAGSACDATAPEWFQGTYRLERLEGMPLPATIVRSGAVSLTLIQQQLVLGDDGSGVMTASFRTVSSQSPQGSISSTTRRLVYEVTGQSIEIRFPCDDTTTDCVGASNVAGEITADGLAVGPPESSKPASTYVRVK